MIMREHARGGLAVVGPGLSFETPAPFTEFFEPIRLGDDAEALKVLSGAAPTRDERHMRVVWWILGVLGFIGMLALLISWAITGSTRLVAVIAGICLVFIAIILIAKTAMRIGGTWYLLPSGVAIARYLKRPPELVIHSRQDTVAICRMVSTGKSVVLKIELIPSQGKRRSTGVTDREAISFLAAWQSPLDPPKREHLTELIA